MEIFCLTQGTQTALCNNLEGWEMVGGGRGVQEGGDICTPMASSCSCFAEIRLIFLINYPSVKNN